MRLGLLVLVGLVVAASATAIEYSFIEAINSNPASTWTAGKNVFFEGKSLEQIQHLMGWKPHAHKKIPLEYAVYEEMDVPTSFNSITNWPNCTSIGSIQNQGECGSCWAFGCVEAVTDRFCIASHGTMNISQLSEQELTSCGPDSGCQGGEAGSAWDWVKRHGLVTAEEYPYKQPTCPPAQQPCPPSEFKPTLPCHEPSSSVRRYKVQDVYGVRGDDIAQEIMTNGPVEVCFTVYQDFLAYKSGVYKHTTGPALGGHCVKAVGWGVLNGEPYWLINNSWTTTWGMNGQFMIARGVDECGIESDCVAGMPDLS